MAEGQVLENEEDEGPSDFQWCDGPNYVVCQHCGAENQVCQLPRAQGDPQRWEAIGILNPRGLTCPE